MDLEEQLKIAQQAAVDAMLMALGTQDATVICWASAPSKTRSCPVVVQIGEGRTNLFSPFGKAFAKLAYMLRTGRSLEPNRWFFCREWESVSPGGEYWTAEIGEETVTFCTVVCTLKQKEDARIAKEGMKALQAAVFTKLDSATAIY